jgi:flagellin
MALQSVNTNMGAMVALQSLEQTQSQLATTQKQISTGFRVADSTDDGAAYAIAQGVRSNVGALTSANQQLGNAQGLLQTANTSLTSVSNTMSSMRDVLVKLGDSAITTSDRTNYVTQYQALAASVKSDIQGATYNTKSLVGNISNSLGVAPTGWGSVNVSSDENGDTYNLKKVDGSGIYSAVNYTGTQLQNAASVLGFISATGSFLTQQTAVGNDLNTIGSSINYVNHQTTYNNDKVDALNTGLGSLVDADLAKESAQLTALQIRQQLGTQALSLANQAPQSLLSLFK